MKKIVFALSLVLFASLANAQTYNNEWIDYSKTYYKFKVGRTGLYRITAASLTSIGLANQAVQDIQVWRNGKQVALFSSVAAGPIGGGYIEFWGEQNDGTFDRNLYRQPEYQLSDKLSLQTDTAAYFLTVNTSGNNLRYINTDNNVANNTLTPEPYFMHSARHNFKDRIHRGFAVPTGEYIYSSSYDVGEMWASFDITPLVAPAACSPSGSAGMSATLSLSNLFVATSGPAATFRASFAGSAPNARGVKVDLNNTRVIDTTLDFFQAKIFTNTNVPLSAIASNNASLRLSTTHSCVTTDRIVAGFVELTYPRLFNFNNEANFSFTMPASAAAKYIEITNFNTGGTPPVLYDLTNNRRYVAQLSSGVVRIVLQPSSAAANLVLVSQATANNTTITSFETRNFVNYSTAANQGNYLVISNNRLRASFSGADQVELFRAYRSSAAGGSYNAKVYDIDQLVDQFAYGIKKHPISIKNFLKYARANFAAAPKFVFLLGKGTSYDEYRINEAKPDAEAFNLVPTWGYPASDVLLVSSNMEPVNSTLVGRVSAVTPSEVADYLSKVKQYEQAQQNQTQTVDNRAWMKTVVHVAGGNDPTLDARLTGYLRNYETSIKDTLFGGHVVNFNKITTGPVTPIVNSVMEQTFQKGISLLTYFGHSSASSLDYNLDEPNAYNNQGKYPIFLVLGCNAGNLYSYEVERFGLISTLSEKYVLAKNRGSIAFIASTHFGLENYLHYYTTGLYAEMGSKGYGKTISENMSAATNTLLSTTGSNDFYGRIHAEQTALHGDPAIRVNSFSSPDFNIEEPQIKVNPTIVSAADEKFTVKAYFYNLGKATGDSVSVQFKRQFPDGTISTILSKKIRSVRYLDSVSVDIPIIATRDKGENKITVSIDDESRYVELSESNNSATKTFSIFEDELRPVYPYNYSIVNKQGIKLSASTANPLVGSSRAYLMEIDTTELFNSSIKVSRSVNSSGGLIEFEPGITFTDSTVYYWRVAPSATSGIRWNNASFIYINNSSAGYNQSHFYQHTKSTPNRLVLDSSSRRWRYTDNLNSLIITNTIFPTSNYDNDFSVSINGSIYIASACDGPVIQFNVLDPVTFKPWKNIPVNGVGMNGSVKPCAPTRDYNFDFLTYNAANRQKAMRFMDSIPDGYIVVVRNIASSEPHINTYANDWKNDQNVFGAGNSLYHKLVAHGFTNLDSFNKPRSFGFVYKKNRSNEFRPVSKVSEGIHDIIKVNADVPTPDSLGSISSPKFGPATAWKEVKWRGSSLETTAGDVPAVAVIGIRPTGQEDTLYRLNRGQQDFNISSVSATQYPNIRLAMRNADSVSFTPYQLRYWRVLYDPVPEGALAPALSYKAKDTLEIGEKLDFSIAFKNISDVAFADSMKVKMVVYDKNNVATVIPVPNKKKLAASDTINVGSLLDTRNLTGNNTLYLDVNPDLAQPEQYRNNNFLYKNFYVRPDTYNPLMDVTFDGVHILNGDIVAARPKIVIKLKDEAKFLALDDTSLAKVFVRYPSGTLRKFTFGSDTLRFIPADLASGKNEAMMEFNPYFMEDSGNDYYELIVSGSDRSGNSAGNIEYKVRFQVYNKAMISNMFNYPNPFTTSTAFVFTITGSEVPQNIRIQVLTITGKIVREITKDELGPLHIGRNITEFKWDGTDQYGQKLGNGIYLYRVITNLNGNSLEKFNTIDSNGDKVNTDKFFNKGYGKMYLMR